MIPSKDGPRKGVKKGIDQNESRRKREATTVQLRKDKKDDNLQKRRRDPSGVASTPSQKEVGALPDASLRVKLDNLPADVALLQSSDPVEQLEATSRFRKLLSIERHPPIAEVIHAGVVPRLVQFLQCYDNQPLVFEAAWALTNISSGTSEHTRVVIDNGAVPVFVQMTAMSNTEVQEQAVWALGNIAGDSPRCRDLVLSYQIVPLLLAQMTDGQGSWTKLSMLRNATWTLSNLCRGKPPPRWALVAQALPLLVELIMHDDEEVLYDACWALSYVSEPADQIQAVIDAGALPRLILLLGRASAQVQTPALRAVGNITSGTAEQTRAVLDCDVLPAALSLLHSPKKEIRKEACWMISNLTAGSAEQIDMVCQAGLMPRLVEICQAEEFDIRKEATYAVCNACLGGNPSVVRVLLDLKMLPTVIELLELPEPQLVLTVLESIEALLQMGAAAAGDGPNLCVELVNEAGGVEKIEQLQKHENGEIYNKAAHLLEQHFGALGEEDVLITPIASDDGFAFGIPQL